MLRVQHSIIFRIIINSLIEKNKQSMMYDNTEALTTGMVILRKWLGHVVSLNIFYCSKQIVL